jgi:PKD repeat protein
MKKAITTVFMALLTFIALVVPGVSPVIAASPPIASFNFTPADPSVFDTVQFSDTSSDPEGDVLQMWEWDFGDGTTSQDQNPNHQYTADGDYTVLLTVTTTDGRTASITQTVPVRTHDVAIIRFSLVKAAVTGLTRKVTVDIESERYPDEVSVELYKSTGTGFTLVGCLSESVPVHNGKKPTNFTFSYTFTDEDAGAGWVTFKAVASIVGLRDAFPTDNEFTAAPTKVVR